MKYLLIAYKDEDLGNYFLDARDDLNKYLEEKSKSILNDISEDSSVNSFMANCICSKDDEKNIVFHAHGNEDSILDGKNECFLDVNTNLSDFKIKIFYSIACETAKGNLKKEIIKESKIFYGYNKLSYVAIGKMTKVFIECDNYCIKEIIQDQETSKQNLMEKTEEFFRLNIDNLIKDDLIVEAAFLMHNKESIEIH